MSQKKYCMNCGYANEYSATPPSNCEKCKKEFEAVAMQVSDKGTIRIFKKGDNEDERIELTLPEDFEQVEGSEFNEFMDGEPEPLSEKEISKIFLAGGNQGFNLKDFVEEELKHPPKKTEKPKTKTRPKKSKSSS